MSRPSASRPLPRFYWPRLREPIMTDSHRSDWEEALHWLDHRTQERELRAVEGTHTP
jgi:hypothetical protein